MSNEPTPSESAGGGFETVIAGAAMRGIKGMLPAGELQSLARALAKDPQLVLGRLGRLAVETCGIAWGNPASGTLDGRFRDRAWTDNPIFSRVAHSYAATCDALIGLLDEADLDWRTRERLRMPLENLLAAASPTNTPLTNPVAWKEVIDTGGGSLIGGPKNLLADLTGPTRLPNSVDREGYALGVNLAATAGKIVRRERLFELIEYLPTTEEVDEVPVLMVPSPVNKFYLLDLEPEHSIVAAHVARGRRVFVPSFVQPDASTADLGFDAYVEGVVTALETVAEIADQDRVHLLGLCGGGQLVLMTAAYLAAVGRQDLLATLSIGIAVVDFDQAQSMVFLNEKTGEQAIKQATSEGCFPAADAARSFALARPIEGIWNGVVNNWVLGRKPPRMGLLYWAADQTNMATQFGADMIRTALSNGLAQPGGVTILGVPINTRDVTVDTYVLGASTDHISPWKQCFQTLTMVGAKVRFVLAAGGHAIVISRPPDHPRSRHWTGEVSGTDPDAWLAAAKPQAGSWWNDWTAWIEEHEPKKVAAPVSPGSRTHPPLADAPGDYVRVMVT